MYVYCMVNSEFLNVTGGMYSYLSLRVLYRWLLSVVFGALVLKLLVWCYVSGLRASACNRDK